MEQRALPVQQVQDKLEQRVTPAQLAQSVTRVSLDLLAQV
jgi:hypothetical protein